MTDQPLSRQDSLAPNQHDPRWSAETVHAAILAALEAWEAGGCECCCPTVLDHALDGITVDQWERMRRWGLEMAMGAQWQIDEEAKTVAS